MSSVIRSRIYTVVARIPKGKVATYGQVAALAGFPRHARQVGYALAALEDERLPWHRVMNAKGEVSPRAIPGVEHLQRKRLEKEGVRFNRMGKVALSRCQWNPKK